VIITICLTSFCHATKQKHSEEYNEDHGGKWSISNLRLYLEGAHGKAITDKLFEDIEVIVITSLKAVQNIMINDKHCFEMYGYDILIDSGLRPWLLEVNASPSLSATTTDDRMLKTRLINDVMAIVAPSSWWDWRGGQPQPMGNQVGGFTLLLDEEQEKNKEDKNKDKKPKRTSSWR